jgi:hypothetical protein
MSATIEVAGEALRLLPERALLWPARRLLMVADAHFGKAARFRTLGVPVPSGTTASNLQVLDALVLRHAVERIVFLGDLMHGRLLHGSATFNALIDWREDCQSPTAPPSTNREPTTISIGSSRSTPSMLGSRLSSCCKSASITAR